MAEYESVYRRYVPAIHSHPPIPESFDRTTSSQPTPRKNTGNKPGPGDVGPLDPRIHYPRTINTPRQPGQGCSSCKWNGSCKVFYWNRNFGHITRDGTLGGRLTYGSRIGIGCESWNVDFPPLPPEDYDQDGLGLGDPFSDGRAEAEGAFDPFTYSGQYGDLRYGINFGWDSWNA